MQVSLGGRLGRYVILSFLAIVTCGLLAAAQSPSLATTTYTTTVTTSVQIVSQSHSGNRDIPVTTSILTTETLTITSTASRTSSDTSASQSTSSSTASVSPTPPPIKLDTKIDPAFGVLGGLLILTGIPSAFLGHKNRWTSFFLMGFYTLSLVCAVLIIRFGVQQANDPPSKSLRGMFVLSSAVAGVIGGGVAVFFWKGTRYFVGAWGGFAFALFIECFRNGGLIDPIGFRYIMYIGCGVVGFTLCTIKSLHYYIVIISTAFVGASAFMLGVDCFTTVGLKEFYIWNLGFASIFPKFYNNGIRFPVTQAMEIELGLLGAVAIMGIAVQLRILKILHRKLAEIAQETRRLDEVEEARAAGRFADLNTERSEWEKDHPGETHARKESGLSSLMPLMQYQDTPGTPGTRNEGSPITPSADARLRTQSGLSIPALDLGSGIQDDVPEDYLAGGSKGKLTATTAAELEELSRKEALLTEIQSLRKSIMDLKDEGSSSASRRHSMASRRTLSNDFNTAVATATGSPRLNAQFTGTRSRIQSMNLDALEPSQQPIVRPTSVPLAEDWDAYVSNRKLLQPPSGITPPISPTPRHAVSPAVLDALGERHRREQSFEAPRMLQSKDTFTHESRHFSDKSGSSGTEDVPLAQLTQQHTRNQSSTTRAPVTILPPVKNERRSQEQSAPRTRTFEELTDRHREKIRELQQPLSSAEKERAQLEKAKERWQRSKEIEREAVSRRQADKSAAVARENQGRKSGDSLTRPSGHGRTLSADKLASLGGRDTTSRRQSVLKVEGWQNQQMEVDSTPNDANPRGSTIPKNNVPFPDPNAKARRMSNPMRRDLVN